jgi:type IV secretory pathway TrbL component
MKTLKLISDPECCIRWPKNNVIIEEISSLTVSFVWKILIFMLWWLEFKITMLFFSLAVICCSIICIIGLQKCTRFYQRYDILVP